MASIPRMIFGFHLAVIGCAFLVWCGNELRWYRREPLIVADAVSVAVLSFVRPRFVLTADGLEFVARIFLEYVWNEPPRKTTMRVEKPKDVALATKRAKEYARVLGCRLQLE